MIPAACSATPRPWPRGAAFHLGGSGACGTRALALTYPTSLGNTPARVRLRLFPRPRGGWRSCPVAPHRGPGRAVGGSVLRAPWSLPRVLAVWRMHCVPLAGIGGRGKAGFLWPSLSHVSVAKNSWLYAHTPGHSFARIVTTPDPIPPSPPRHVPGPASAPAHLTSPHRHSTLKGGLRSEGRGEREDFSAIVRMQRILGQTLLHEASVRCGRAIVPFRSQQNGAQLLRCAAAAQPTAAAASPDAAVASVSTTSAAAAGEQVRPPAALCGPRSARLSTCTRSIRALSPTKTPSAGEQEHAGQAGPQVGAGRAPAGHRR